MNVHCPLSQNKSSKSKTAETTVLKFQGILVILILTFDTRRPCAKQTVSLPSNLLKIVLLICICRVVAVKIPEVYART